MGSSAKPAKDEWLVATLEGLCGQKLDLKVTNQSRPRRDTDLGGIDLLALRRRLAPEYAVYDAIPARDSACACA